LEQYLTSSQTAFHFLRHAKGRPHDWHILVGKSAFFIEFSARNIDQKL